MVNYREVLRYISVLILSVAFTMCRDGDSAPHADFHNHHSNEFDAVVYRSAWNLHDFASSVGVERFHLASLDVVGNGELLLDFSTADTLFIEVVYSYELLNDSVLEQIEGVLRLPFRVTPDFLHRTINFDNISPIPMPDIFPDSI